MSLCLFAGAKATKLASLAFTLAWTHSVQKTTWEEDWLLTGDGLIVTQARVEGSGAGMEPGADARFDGRFWRWRPQMQPVPELVLHNSEMMPEGWRLCVNGVCRNVAGASDPVANVRLARCPPPD
ncbi:MAG: DUF1850 domain-containing protein [Beijerinckiaceae bacterium]